MGLIRGTGSFSRYKVEGDVPKNYMEEYPARISRYAFRDIDDDSDQERSIGWVNIMDMLDSRFTGLEYLKEPCLAMSLRVDVRNVPAMALLRYCREAEDRIKAAEKVEYLPKPRRREIKEAVKSQLLHRAIPRSQTYDMIWNLQTGIVICGATSLKICDEFSEYFFTCFGLPLTAVFPYTSALQVLSAEGVSPDLLDRLKPSFSPEVE